MKHHNGEYAKDPFWTLARRRWAYSLLVALGALAVVFGWVTNEQAIALGVVFAALFGVTGLAVTHPTQDGNE